MKKNIFIIGLSLLLLVASFTRPPILSTSVQVITATSGTVSYYQTTADIWLVLDNAATIAAITVPFPTSPIDGQTFGIAARAAITALTVTASTGSIISSVTALPITTARAQWVYSGAVNRWFRIG